VVAPGSGIPTGTVTFKDNLTTLATVALNASGIAAFSTSSLAAGAHSITAAYAGSGNFSGSTSSAVAQTVNKANSATTLTSSVNPSLIGQTVTFTAVVQPQVGSGVPTGNVTFKDGLTTLATVALNASGVAAFSTSGLAVGVHSITAAYAGSGNFNASTSVTLSQTVHESTTTTLTSSVNPAVLGQTVTFTATVAVVAPGSGIPTGTVTFKDGSTTLATVALNAGGVAAFSSSGLAVGSHNITAAYAGDSTLNASLGTVQQVIQ
jgi:hypothetical protein